MQTSKNAGYIKTLVENGPVNQGLIKHGATSRLTSLEPSRRPKDPQELRTPKAMQRTYNLHNPMQHFSPICIRTTPWRWWISQRLHKTTEHCSRCSQKLYQRYQARLITSPRNSQHHKSKTPGWNNWNIVQPRPRTDIGRTSIQSRHIQPQAKIEMCTPEADRNSTLTGTAPPTATRWRRHTRLRRVASRIMGTTSWLRD